MMKNIRFIYFVLITILIGCVGKKEKKYVDCTLFGWDNISSEIVLHGADLNLGDQITRPMRLSVFDSTLILLNDDNEGIIQMIDLPTKNEIGHYGSFGGGPSDLMTPRYVYKKDSVLYVYDSRLLRFNTFVLNSNDNLNLKNSVQFNSYFDDVLMLSDSILIANVLDPQMKKISYFKGDSMIKTVGDYPQIEENSTDLDVLAQLEGFASSLAWNESKKRIAVVYKQTDLIEIYNENGKLEHRVQGPDMFFPSKCVKDIGETQKVVANIGEERDAYFSPVATANELFVLYSGDFYNPESKDYLHDRLFVFDWDGNPLRQYKLDIPIFRFTIDSSSRVIYGLTDTPEFRVVQFKLD